MKSILPDNWESYLDERQLCVIEETVIGGITMVELARQKNCSADRIRTIRDKAFRTLRQASKLQQLKETNEK